MAKSHPVGLPIPEAAIDDPKSREMIRVWVADKGLHCVINVRSWGNDVDEPAAWAVVLADVARHVANALEEQGGRDAREVALEIRDMFNSEMDHPTSKMKGSFMTRKTKRSK